MENYRTLREKVRKLKSLEINRGERRDLIEKENSCSWNFIGFSAEFGYSLEEAISRGLKGDKAYAYIENPRAFNLEIDGADHLTAEREGLYY